MLLRILSAPLDMRTGHWSHISMEARDLVRRMLTRNPKRRISPEQVLSHAWVCQHCEVEVQAPEPELLARMRAFVRMGELRKHMLRRCARLMPESELVGLRRIFDSMDKDRSGTISLEELLGALRRRGARTISEAEVVKLLDQVAGGEQALLQFEDFVAATLHPSMLLKSEVLVKAFQQADTDGSGSISKTELQVCGWVW